MIRKLIFLPVLFAAILTMLLVVARDETPQSPYIYYAFDGDLFRIRFDGQIQPLITDPALDDNAELSPDGRWLVFDSYRSGVRNVYVTALDHIAPRRLIEDPNIPRSTAARWSPDGSHLVFEGIYNSTGDLITLKPDGSEFTRLTRHEAPDCCGVWSPDGKSIVFESWRDFDRNLYLKQRDDIGLQKLTADDGADCCAQWSPDGQWILFASNRNDNWDIYRVHPDGSDLQRLTDHPMTDSQMVYSPDGEWVIFRSARDGQAALYRMRADGSEQTRISRTGTFECCIAWSPDGQWLSFKSYQHGSLRLYRMAVDGSQIEEIVSEVSGGCCEYWAPINDLPWHPVVWLAVVSLIMGGTIWQFNARDRV